MSDVAMGSAELVAAIFAVIGLIHVYWALGGTWGTEVALPTRGSRPGQPPRFAIHPTPAGTFLVALLLFCAAAVMVGRVGLWAGPPPMLFTVLAWVLAALFLIRAVGEFRYVGFFKSVRDTRFATWDSWLFSPLCLLIAVLCAIPGLVQT